MDVITRKDAQAQGLKRYFTGKPCPSGHIAERFTKGAVCYACSDERARAWIEKNKARKLALDASYREENRPALRAKAKLRYAENPRPVIEAAARYAAGNPEKRAAYLQGYAAANKDARRQINKSYRQRKPWIGAAAYKRRQCRLMKQTPAWADHAAIIMVYEEAARLTRETGIPHEVDHVIPLQGRMVSGLHVEYNLRAIPMLDNRSKGNRLLDNGKEIQCLA